MRDNFSVEDREGGYYIENDSIVELYLELVGTEQFYELKSSFFLPNDYYEGNIVIYRNSPNREGKIYGEELYKNPLKIKIPESIKGEISSVDIITKREVRNDSEKDIYHNISNDVLKIYNITKGQILDIIFYLGSDEETFVVFDYCPSFAGQRISVEDIYDMNITFKLPEEISGEAILVHKAESQLISIQCEDTIDVSVPKDSRLDINKIFENEITDYTSELIILPDNYCPISIELDNFEQDEILVESLMDLSEIELEGKLPFFKDIDFEKTELGIESITESHLSSYEEFNKYNKIEGSKIIRCLPGEYQVSLNKDFCDYKRVHISEGENKTVRFGKESVGYRYTEFFVESDSSSVIMHMKGVSRSVPTNEKFRIRSSNISLEEITFEDVDSGKKKKVSLSDPLKKNFYIRL